MELIDNEILIIEAINSNDVGKICETYDKLYYICIFEKKNIVLFDKNTKYLKYFRGFYYYFTHECKKAKILMKYNNPFIFLYDHFGQLYRYLKRYNKAKYYIKKIKYTKIQKYWQNQYSYLNKYEIKKKKYFIHLILMYA